MSTHPSQNSERPARSGVRWWILALIFAATTINYLDRQALSVLKPILADPRHGLGWSDADYGWITFAFQSAYAIGYPFAGRLVDILGTKLGFALGIAVWSVASMGHAAVRSAAGFAAARFSLGIGESMNFPASLKAVAEWFPQRERAMATGIFNSGTNVGVAFSFIVVWVATRFEWQAAFLVTGVLGLVWLAVWMKCYRAVDENSAVSESEKSYIREGQGPPEPQRKMHWTALLRYRQAWPFFLGKFMTDPVWWFYLYWLPSYLHKEHHLTALSGAAWLIIPYVAADIGSVGGGWLSDNLIKRGVPVGRARYTAMAVCAFCMPGAIIAVYTYNFGLAIALISLATAAHQGWSANLFTTATDMFPSEVAGSVVGLGGTCGAIGGMLMTLLVGVTIQWLHSYTVVFIWAGLMHPLALILFVVIMKGKMPVAVLSPDVEREPRPGLLIGGIVSMVAGAAGLLLTWRNWDSLVTLMKGSSGAAASAAVAIGLIIIGLVLAYASMGRNDDRQA